MAHHYCSLGDPCVNGSGQGTEDRERLLTSGL